ncbi:hypothetical protein AVEN_195380-1 [Araneus ventricosus]|uniref:Integrase catalytic domain-containing protein n=1 Tax=Araneus ventricosus TaxID=182803 RepID=A0A4Y2DK78_ARAVE|nr:hypothetical protein AVEN_195380-1 [Araneus ventricosus]
MSVATASFLCAPCTSLMRITESSDFPDGLRHFRCVTSWLRQSPRHCWISRFGVPEIITSDRGSNFEASIFRALTRFLGTGKTRTISFHPAANKRDRGKGASTAEGSDQVLRHFQLVRDPAYRAAENACLSQGGYWSFACRNGVRSMLVSWRVLQKLHFRPVSTSDVFVHPDLRTSTHVLVRRDTIRKTLEQPYQGPFKVLRRKDKFFTLSVSGRQTTVSIDRSGVEVPEGFEASNNQIW